MIWCECWKCSYQWYATYKEKVCPNCGSDEVTYLEVADKKGDTE